MRKVSPQKSIVTTKGSNAYNFLKWAQAHPALLKNTTNLYLASSLAEQQNVLSGVATIQQVIGRMVRASMLYREKAVKGHGYNFRINYYHKDIPQDILANAPVEVKRAMVKTLDDMKPEQYMDEEGCVVTPNAVEKTEDPFGESEVVDEQKDFGSGTALHEIGLEEPVVLSRAEPVSVEKDVEVPSEISVPVKVEKKENGKTLNLTININLNL